MSTHALCVKKYTPMSTHALRRNREAILYRVLQIRRSNSFSWWTVSHGCFRHHEGSAFAKSSPRHCSAVPFTVHFRLSPARYRTSTSRSEFTIVSNADGTKWCSQNAQQVTTTTETNRRLRTDTFFGFCFWFLKAQVSPSARWTKKRRSAEVQLCWCCFRPR